MNSFYDRSFFNAAGRMFMRPVDFYGTGQFLCDRSFFLGAPAILVYALGFALIPDLAWGVGSSSSLYTTIAVELLLLPLYHKKAGYEGFFRDCKK